MTLPIDTIICGDCLEIMKDWPDNCVDLVVTSPPYNTGGKSLTQGDFYIGYKDNLSQLDYRELLFQSVRESIRISRYAMWNIQMLSGNKDAIIQLLYNFRGNLKDICIWRKQAVAQINKGIIAKGFEFVLMFGDDATMEFAPEYFPDNNYVPNIIEIYKTEFIENHHATFPVKLPKYFIENFSPNDGLILDPFCGSGTTCVAAKMLGRNYIGIDISEEYCKIARMRIKAVDTGVPVKEQLKGQMGLFK